MKEAVSAGGAKTLIFWLVLLEPELLATVKVTVKDAVSVEDGETVIV